MATVLIVDDHAINRELVVSLLDHLGHQPLEAADGAEALALVHSQRPQLVICDILMPTMDGYEFVQRLRADPAVAATEVIFYTANYHEREARHLAASVGVSHVLIKPCIPEDIIRAIESALARESASIPVADAGEFDHEHLRLVTDKLAEKADDLQNANLRLAALTDLNLQLASERDPHTLLDKVCHGARELIGAKYAFLCIRAKNNGQAVYSFSSGLQLDEAGKLPPPPIGNGLMGKVMAESKPLRFLNPGGSPEAIGLPSGYPQVHNTLVVPIVSLRLMYGWICLVDKVGAAEFSAEDERILAIHAAQAGRIYENGSLYVQIEKRAAELQVEVVERRRSEQALAESQKRLDGIVTSAMDAIVTVGEDERIVLANPAAQAMFGYSSAELLGEPLDLLIPERFRASHSAHLAAYGNSGVTTRRMGWLRPVLGRRKNGEEFFAEASISKDEFSGRRLFTAILRDITENKRAGEKIRRLNRVYAVLSAINTLIVRVRDRDELFRDACQVIVEAGQFVWAYIAQADADSGQLKILASYGIEPHQLEKMRTAVSTPIPGDEDYRHRVMDQHKPVIVNHVNDELPPRLQEAYCAGNIQAACVLPLVSADRTTGVVMLGASEAGFFDAEEMKLLLELAGDIAFAMDNLEKSARLDYLAYYDQLTGLANATLFRERLEQQLQMASESRQWIALMLLDIERFKTVNDALGRQVGDMLLQQLTERLLTCAGGADRVAHLGADRFALIQPVVGDERDLARKIEVCLDICFGPLFPLADTEFKAAAKLGIALYPVDGADADALFRNAETALKKAKAGGERYLFYSAPMNARVAEQLSLESQLRRALENDEFVLHYQPKVAVGNRRIVSVEALIRWNDPETGLVPPMEFIPLLEETGLILEVGKWALHRAVRDHFRWRQAGLAAPRIAVNVSAIQLRQSSFVEVVRQAVAQGTSPPGIDLEITESLIMENIESNIDKLKAIREMGLSISIDDFGTGYSSLAYLAKLPVGEIKIDRSFIITMLQETNTMTMVSTIIALAHSMGLKVVAEGVDQEEQAEVLRLLGCEQMQGYLFSRPVPFEEMAALISKQVL